MNDDQVACAAEVRICTCPPDDRPVQCQRKYALGECLAACPWRDMRTAPRDQTAFLMSYHYKGGASYVTIAHSPPSYAKRFAWWRSRDENIPVIETHPPDTEHECYATGWQPLPEPLEVEDE